MSTIDQTLDSFLADEDDLSAFEDKTLPLRTGAIFLIDCTPTMLSLTSKDMNAPISQSCGFHLGLLACQTVLQNKAINSPSDMVGLVLMRTRTSSSPDRPNIYVLQALAPPDAPRVLELENLRKSTPADLERRFGSIANTREKLFGLHEALWTCQNLFTASSKSMGLKTVFLLTDDPDPHRGNAHANRQSCIKMSDLRLGNITVEVLPIKHEGSKFDFDIFYNDLLSAGEANTLAGSYQVDASDRLEELLTRVYSREKNQRRVARFKFHLGPESALAFGVTSYCLIRREPPPSSTFIHAKDSQPLRARRHWRKARYSDDSDSPLLPYDVVRGVRFGDRYLCFESDELQSVMQDIAPIGLHLLGFKPIKTLKRHYYIRSGQFLYPDEASVRGSRVWFSALLQTCIDRQVTALALCVQRKSLPPRLVALLPQPERIDEEGNQLDPPGFQIIYLPFADDFRELELPETVPASVEQVESAKAMVKKLMVPFSPQQISNPVLQRHYTVLEALALNRENSEEVPDHTVPNTSAIRKRAASEIEAFKQCCHLDDSVLVAKKCRPDAAVVGMSDPKMKNSASASVNLSENELREIAREGKLSKLTVPQLRHALKILNCLPTGSKKAELVEQISKLFAT